MKTKHIFLNEFFIVFIIYFVCILIINPVGEFPINDDWIFFRQIEAFQKGYWTISVLIDPSFILQGLLGYIWSFIFGLSFTSLRMLSLAVTALSLFGFYKTLKLFNIAKKRTTVLLLLFIFNPLIFISSFTYMTDNYFLLFFVWSVFFYLKFLQTNKLSDGLFGSFFVGCSILVRQFGLLTFLSFGIIYCLKSKNLKRLFLLFLPVLIGLFIFILWPRYPTELLDSFISMESFPDFLLRPIHSLPYFALFLLPFLLKQPAKKAAFTLVILTIIVHSLIYKRDIFFVGNVFYIEELYAKYFYKSNLSLFDNIPFSIFISLIISYAVSNLLLHLAKQANLKAINALSSSQVFLILTGIFTLLSLAIISDYYDRYLLPSFYCFILLIKDFKISRSTYAGLAIIFFLSFFLQWEYFSQTRLRWQQANTLSATTGLTTQIFVDGVWDRFNTAKKNSNYDGIGDKISTANYKCYVQKYTIDTDNPVLGLFQATEKIFERITYNPRIYNSKKLEISSAKNNLETLIYNKEYFSPLYTLIGKKVYVGSWCITEE